MARIKYFSDNYGKTTELAKIYGMRNAEFAARFPGVKGRRRDGIEMAVGFAEGATRADVLPVTRVIEYRASPSRHECNARCVNASGRIMKCECACGGKNHGASALVFTAIAP